MLQCEVDGETVTLIFDEVDSTDEEDYVIGIKWGKGTKNRASLEAIVKPKAGRGQDGLVPMVREAFAAVVEEYKTQ